MEQVSKAARLTTQQKPKRASRFKMKKFLRNEGTLLTLMLAAAVIRAAPTTIEETLDEQQQQLFANLTFSCSLNECDDQLNRQHLRTILSNMKAATDPCLDYHEYACGNWRNIHTNGTTMLKLGEEILMKKYVDLFERWQHEEVNEVNGYKGLNEVQEKMFMYYKVCRSLENSGRLSLKGYLHQMTEQGNLWRLQDFVWLKTLAELGRFGYRSHFVKYLMIDNNATYQQFWLEPHDQQYTMSWSAEIGAALEDYASQERHETLQTVLQEFERKLLSLLNNEEDDNNTEEEMTIAELNAATNNLRLDWQHYVSKILGRQLETTYKISVTNIDQIRKLASFLQQQEPEILMLYSMARFLNYLQEQKPNFLAEDTHANSYNCLKHMRKTHYVAMNYVYELEYYSKQRASSDVVIFTLFNKLKEQFKETLEENAMELTTPQLNQLLVKLSNMRINTGNLPMNVTPTFYSDYVRNLSVSAHNFYHNHLHALQHFYAQKYLMLNTQEQEFSSPIHSFQMFEPDYEDIYYISPIYAFNMIVIPFAYLDLPFYNQHFWDMLLYGDLANMLGHELMHGFDQNFLPYDSYTAHSKVQENILKNSNFKKNLDCLEFDTEFLAERIADVSGIKLTISTFMQNATLSPEEWRLFFMQYAQFFCGSTDLASFRAEDPDHDMDNKRLNYVLAHTPEFAQTYSCQLGSPMHPTTRCHMW